MTEPRVPSAHDNFDQWLEAYLVTHPCESGCFSPDDMFSAWVGGAIFTADRMFNPSRPGVPPLPDIFRDIREATAEEAAHDAALTVEMEKEHRRGQSTD